MRALRLPTHASPVTYLLRFRGPRDSSTVRARRCRRSRASGGPASDQDHCSTGDPPCRCALAWTRVGFLRFPGDPSCAFAPVYDPGRTDDPSPMAVSPVLPLLQREQRLQRVIDFGATARLQHLLSTLHERRCHSPCKTCFRPAGWPLPGGSSNPLDRDKRFPSGYISSSSAAAIPKAFIPDADAVSECGRQHGQARQRERTARRGHRPWHVQKLLAREPGDLTVGQQPRYSVLSWSASGRRGAVADDAGA